MIGALAVTALCGSGLLRRAELWFCDELFARREYVPGDIVIIGIDESDFEQFGPYNTWDRSVMASALDALASDPDNLPAVVAIDTLYGGYTNEEADAKLAESAAKLGNVITATEAHFGTTRTFGATSVIIDDYAILSYEEPYDSLKNVTVQGHINAMYDTDGVMRHPTLYIEPEGENGRRVYSMAYEAASAYAKTKGYSIQTPPLDSLGRFYVSYTGGPTDFYDGISLNDLINGDVPSSYYAGKLVLIGPYAPGLQDAYFTPIERGEMMYGVEYQANVIQCLLDSNTKRKHLIFSSSEYSSSCALRSSCSAITEDFFSRFLCSLSAKSLPSAALSSSTIWVLSRMHFGYHWDFSFCLLSASRAITSALLLPSRA